MTAVRGTTVVDTTARTVSVTPHGLRLHDTGRSLQLFSASVQYWRLDRDRWPAILRAVRELGFTGIETYVPWAVHETAPGRFDFTGRLDLDAFLTLAAAEGLWVIARPGPHINAELSEFGYPARIIHDPDIQARTASGAPAVLAVPPRAFPIPSYASDRFFTEVGTWFDEVCPRLERHLYPDGPIVLLQADNENSYFFKLSPYDVDYSEPAVRQYRQFLRRRYDAVESLNDRYRTDYRSFDDVDPPRRFDATAGADLVRYLDWASAKEAYLTDSIATIADMLRERGLGKVPLAHNTPGAYGTPYNQPAIESAVDIQGIDLYEHVDGYNVIKRNCLYLDGTSRLPYLPEFGAGAWPWWRPIEDADARHNTLTALMHGIKGINYYMAVERERWLGSPISRTGQLRPGSEFYREILELLRTVDWSSYRRRADVLLLEVREYERHAHAARAVSPPFGPHLLGPLDGLARAYGPLGTRHPTVHRPLDLGLDLPTALRDYTDGCWSSLTAAHIPFTLGDSGSGTERLSAVPVIVAPGFGYLARSTQQTLADYVELGGRLVIGPEIPTMDETMAPCTVLADRRSPHVRQLRQVDQLPQVLADLGVVPPWTLDNPSVDLAVHERSGSRLLFLANPTDQPQTAILTWPDLPGLKPILDASRFRPRGTDSYDIDLAPHDIQLFEVAPC